MPRKIDVIERFKSQKNIDSLEIVQGSQCEFEGMLACCQYQLDTDTRERYGGIEFQRLKETCTGFERGDYFVKDLGVGVLDSRWHVNFGFTENHGDLHLICADTSYKRVRLSADSDDPSGYALNVVADYKLDVEEGNKTSIGVAIDVRRSDEAALITASSGNCAIVSPAGQEISKWKAHEAEVWAAAFDPRSDGNIIATGADDCLLRFWDCREGFSRPIMQNKKTHEGGVTVCYFPSTMNNAAGTGREHEFLTGSYDDHIRIWDMRMGIERPTHEYKVGGGVWRIKPISGGALDQCVADYNANPADDFLLVGACYGGSEVWRFGGPDALEMVGECRPEGASMAYGVCTFPGKNGKHWAASCHFYDQCVAVWPLH